MKLRFLLLCLVAVFILSGVKVFAASSSSILVDVAPPNPAPGEDTTITLSSYANNLDSVLITWSVNGTSILSGIGKKTFLVKAPPAGSFASVRAVISLPEGEIEKTITIRPNEMILLWQATDSFVPPFYKGKALPLADSEIKIVAMPEIKSSVGGALVNAKNMTYAWKKDYTNDQEASGYGKNFYIYTNDYLEGSNNVSVVAGTTDQKSTAEASVDVGTAEPKIIFYKNDPGFGTIWEHALPDTYRITGAEVVQAAPYFISPKELQHPSLVWNWSINGNMVPVPSYRKNFMPLRTADGTSGVSTLSLMIENVDRIFQTVRKEINIEF